MMRLAWLVRDIHFGDSTDEEDNPWQIMFEEPCKYRYTEVKPIVYAELG